MAERVASVHGELAYVEGRLADDLPEPLREGLAHRRGELVELRAALYVTLRQFDPALDPTAIGTTEEWLEALRARDDSAEALRGGARRHLPGLSSRPVARGRQLAPGQA